MESYDELLSEAPEWYAGIVKLLGRGKNDEALRQAREQYKISTEENPSKEAQMAAQRLIIKAQLGKDDSWNARKTADDAVNVAKGSGNQKAMAAAMHMLAKVLLKEKKLDEAIAAAKEAESIFESVSFQAGVAAAMGTRAAVHYTKKEADIALEISNASVQIFKEVADFCGQAGALKVAVDMKMSENRYYHALLLVEEIVTLYNQAGDAEGEAGAQLLASQLQVEQGDLQNAMDRSSAAVELFHQVGDSRRKAASVLVMAKAFEAAGQMKDAAQAAEAAVSLFQEGRDKRGQASALLCLASTLIASSQYGAASYRYEEAAFVFRQLKDKREEARAMALMASTQLKMFKNERERPLQGWEDSEIEQCAKNAARSSELLGESGAKGSVEVAKVMLSEAEAMNLLKRFDEALAKAGEAETHFKDNGDLAGQSEALVIIGNAYTGKSMHDVAIEAMEKARELAEEVGVGLSVKEVSLQIKEIGRHKLKAKKPLAEGDRFDIHIVRNDVPIITYTAFEGRQMRTGPSPSSKRELKPGDAGYVAPQRQKVLYNLRMQRVPNVDLTAGAPQAILA